MKKCNNKKRILYYIEDLMTPEEKNLFENHLIECEECRQELSEYRKLYDVIDKDVVSFPDKAFFERARKIARKEEIPLKKPLWKFFGVLVPVFGLIVILILFNFEKERYIEMSISVNNFLQDKDLNTLLMDRIIDDELIKEFNVIEEYFTFEPTQVLIEMTRDEKQELIKILVNKYGESYL